MPRLASHGGAGGRLPPEACLRQAFLPIVCLSERPSVRVRGAGAGSVCCAAPPPDAWSKTAPPIVYGASSASDSLANDSESDRHGQTVSIARAHRSATLGFRRCFVWRPTLGSRSRVLVAVWAGKAGGVGGSLGRLFGRRATAHCCCALPPQAGRKSLMRWAETPRFRRCARNSHGFGWFRLVSVGFGGAALPRAQLATAATQAAPRSTDELDVAPGLCAHRRTTLTGRAGGWRSRAGESRPGSGAGALCSRAFFPAPCDAAAASLSVSSSQRW
eukprot:SAG31_NODE_13482_length_866_cov_0.926988_1_plen_273_part_01